MARTKREQEEVWTEKVESGASNIDSDTPPNKRRKVVFGALAHVARNANRSPQPTTSPTTGLLTPEASCLTEPAADQPPKDTFPLFKLPAELRLHIYRSALCSPTPLPLDLPRKGHGTGYTYEGSPVDPPWRPNVALLRTCSTIHNEARPLLYADNAFTLSTHSAISALASLHQRSRSLIRSVALVIHSHNDLINTFADVVRLGLRYCWGLQTFTIGLPYFDTYPMPKQSSSVYANAFRILRWLPKGCKVVLEGCVNDSVRRIVAEEGSLLVELDDASYFRRQWSAGPLGTGSTEGPGAWG